ncbi:MAG: GyrI-like domain-containing protein [Chlorobiaceae bacterium]|nr:GyrI-like domain-containing protein [Chlorobiaceae bacterium]
MDFECSFSPELKDLVSRPALTIRTRTKVSGIALLFKEGYGEIARLLKERGAHPVGPPFALYFNMDMDDLEVEFGFPVDKPVEGSGRIIASATPSGKAVSTLYIGPYNEVEPAYDSLMKWSADNKLTPNGTACEVYLNDPAVTPPELLKTEVSLLLAD